jgi:1,2-diacylglycerol 3-alpha-glucosyltransferase
MRRRLLLITEIIAPYRVPVFNALAERADIELHVVFLSETDSSLRDWAVPRDEIRFSYQVLPSFRRRLGKYNFLINWCLRDALEKSAPEAIVCGGYNYLVSWQAAYWAKRQQVPFLLWLESTASDHRGHLPFVEALKRNFLKMCRGFVVPGVASREYLQQFGISGQRIFRAPNAVDNRLFTERSKRARAGDSIVRKKLGLPERYFLNVGRLVEAKGVFELLAAYAKLDPALRSSVGLVFVGEGASKSELIACSSQISPGNVMFAGFVQKERLAEFYALSDALVFPTHSDPWGFVVNEAMACGLPVIASEVAGCVPDLIQNGWNGMVVPSKDVNNLSAAMELIATSCELRSKMGARSIERLAAYSPEACAAGIAGAVASMQGSDHDPRV